MLHIAQYSSLINLSLLLSNNKEKYYHRIIKKHFTFTKSDVSYYVTQQSIFYAKSQYLLWISILVKENTITGL